MKDKQAFLDKWRTHMVGWGMLGLYVETTEGPLQRAGHAIKVVPEAERLLSAMYDWIAQDDKPLPAKLATPNGTHQATVKK